MGFITSPVISNIIFRELDIKIQKFCSEKNIIYTRYADDMLFSSNRESCFVHSESFYKEIAILLNLKKFKLNYNKTLYSKHTLSLNGYTLQYSKKEKGKEKKINELRLSNKKTNTLKKLIYKIKTKKDHPKDILKTLFNFDLNKLTIPYAVTNNTLKEKMYYDQLLNKITGYRSYLLSIIVFNKKYNCTQNTTIDKYIEIIRSLNEIITKYTDITEKLSIIIEKERSTIK